MTHPVLLEGLQTCREDKRLTFCGTLDYLAPDAGSEIWMCHVPLGTDRIRVLNHGSLGVAYVYLRSL